MASERGLHEIAVMDWVADHPEMEIEVDLAGSYQDEFFGFWYTPAHDDTTDYLFVTDVDGNAHIVYEGSRR